MTLELLVKCNRCRREWDIITIEQVNDILKEADQQDKPLSEVAWRCGPCVAKDTHEAIHHRTIDKVFRIAHTVGQRD